MLHVQTCIATYGEHYKHMSHSFPPQNEVAPGALGTLLMLEKVKLFTQAIQKDSVKLFLLRFVFCLNMMFQ